MPRKLALEALARGYLRCLLFDTDGRYYGFRDVHIQDLLTMKSIQIPVVLHAKRRGNLPCGNAGASRTRDRTRRNHEA